MTTKFVEVFLGSKGPGVHVFVWLLVDADIVIDLDFFLKRARVYFRSSRSLLTAPWHRRVWLGRYLY